MDRSGYSVRHRVSLVGRISFWFLSGVLRPGFLQHSPIPLIIPLDIRRIPLPTLCRDHLSRGFLGVLLSGDGADGTGMGVGCHLGLGVGGDEGVVGEEAVDYG